MLGPNVVIKSYNMCIQLSTLNKIPVESLLLKCYGTSINNKQVETKGGCYQNFVVSS